MRPPTKPGADRGARLCRFLFVCGRRRACAPCECVLNAALVGGYSLSLLSLDGRRTLSQPSTASSLRRPHSSSAGTVRPPHSASGARERPGSQIGQRPSSRARDRSRPLGITQPRPRSSVAYSSLDRDSPAPKRPSTSLGTRTLVEPKTKGDAKKVDVIPPRTPLRPVTPCGWMEQQKAQKDFLQFVSAGDSPSPPRPIQKMKGADSKETEAMHSNRIEPAETSVDARPARAPAHMRRESRMPRWKEIIGLRKGDRVRTVHGGGEGRLSSPSRNSAHAPSLLCTNRLRSSLQKQLHG